MSILYALTIRYIGYFLPEKRLHLPISNMENMNSEDDLHRTLSIVDENIKRIRAFSSGGQIEGHQADQVLLLLIS